MYIQYILHRMVLYRTVPVQYRTGRDYQVSDTGTTTTLTGIKTLLAVTTKLTTNFSRVVLIYSVHRRRRKNSTLLLLGKSPRSGGEKFQPQQPCPTIIPVWRYQYNHTGRRPSRGHLTQPAWLPVPSSFLLFLFWVIPFSHLARGSPRRSRACVQAKCLVHATYVH